MASIRIIKRRIKSAKNISQITRAMQMVAASKMRKAQDKAVKGKPYASKITQMVYRLAKSSDPALHPLLRRDGGEKLLVILIATNKGLCGALNTELFRSLSSLPSDEAIDFVVLGRRGANFLAKTGKSMVADFSKEPFTDHVSAISQFIIERFLAKKYRTVVLCYNAFLSALRQEPIKESLLPLHLLEEANEDTQQMATVDDSVIEPNKEEIFESLLPYFIEVKVRSAILQAEASEHSARMIAMKNATDNAKEFIGDLTLELNKARQQAITYEIADMVTARSTVEE